MVCDVYLLFCSLTSEYSDSREDVSPEALVYNADRTNEVEFSKFDSLY